MDFLIAHLDQYGAVEALANTKSPKALPALQQRLDKLTHESQRKDLDFAVTKIAVTKLSYQHPAEPLLALAEDRTNNDWLRHDALIALRDYAAPALHPRLLRLFRDDPDLEVKLFCLSLLEDSSLKGVTEAFIDYALAFKPPKDICGFAMQANLVAALDKRLGCSCRNLDTVRNYLRTRPSNSISAKTDPR